MTSDVSVDVFQRKKPKRLVSEILRPTALSDLTLPMPTIHRLERVIESGAKVNMLFYGPPGSGKTSTARIFVKPRISGFGVEHSHPNGSQVCGTG